MPESDSEHRRGYTESGLVPIPDPTVLTTSQLDRAIRSLEDKLNERLSAMDKASVLFREERHGHVKSLFELLDAKILALEQASIARYTNLRDVSTERFNAITSLFAERELRTKAISDHISTAREENIKYANEASQQRNLILSHEEKFRSVQQQFRDNKTAVDAALAAAKDAVDKQNAANTTATYKAEAAFTKQIDQLNEASKQTARAFDEKITDLKERVQTLEALLRERVQALESTRKGSDSAIGWVVAGVGLLISLGILITAIVVHWGGPH